MDMPVKKELSVLQVSKRYLRNVPSKIVLLEIGGCVQAFSKDKFKDLKLVAYHFAFSQLTLPASLHVADRCSASFGMSNLASLFPFIFQGDLDGP